MTFARALERARRAAASATLLLEAGDSIGACNRSYYAMFDAARAALIANDVPVEPEWIKAHSGMIGAFSRHLIKPGLIPVQFGRSLGRVDQIRMLADYVELSIELEIAKSAVGQAHDFVAAVAAYLDGLIPRGVRERLDAVYFGQPQLSELDALLVRAQFEAVRD